MSSYNPDDSPQQIKWILEDYEEKRRARAKQATSPTESVDLPNHDLIVFIFTVDKCPPFRVGKVHHHALGAGVSLKLCLNIDTLPGEVVNLHVFGHLKRVHFSINTHEKSRAHSHSSFLRRVTGLFVPRSLRRGKDSK